MGKKRKKGTYSISIRGPVPGDLVERISKMHAMAILERLSRYRRETQSGSSSQGASSDG